MRRGVGAGLGKGYKNLLEMDSYIHSLSRRGISQYSHYMNYPKEFPKNTDVKYHQGVFQNQWGGDHPSALQPKRVLREIKDVDKIKKEMFDLLYNVKTYKGEKAVKHEVLTVVVLRDKAHHFDFLKAYTDWNAVGSWTPAQRPFRVQSYDDEKNKVLEIEFLDTKSDKIGRRLEVLLKKLNKTEVGEWLLYSRTTPISETSLSLAKERTLTMKAKGFTNAYIDYKKLKKGQKIKFHSRKGVLMEKPKYISGGSWGGFQAKVKWDDGEVSTFDLNRNAVKFLGTLPPLPKITGKTKNVFGVLVYDTFKGEYKLANGSVWDKEKDAKSFAKRKSTGFLPDFKKYKIKKFKVSEDEFVPVLGDWVYDRGQVHFARSQWQGD
jgi:hypothetical protein